jgi:hypothetical protein
MSGIKQLYSTALSLGLPKMRAINTNRSIFESHIKMETTTRATQAKKSTKALLKSAQYQMAYSGSNSRAEIVSFLNNHRAKDLAHKHKVKIANGKR